MKKLITFCFFALALFFGTQSISAQESQRSAEEIAKEKTNRLSQEFGLQENQLETVWRAFLVKEKAKQELATGKFSEEEVKNISSKVDSSFNSLMQKALSEDQYAKFKLISKEYF